MRGAKPSVSPPRRSPLVYGQLGNKRHSRRLGRRATVKQVDSEERMEGLQNINIEGLRYKRKGAVHSIFPCPRFFENRSVLPVDASVANGENPVAERRDQYGV